MSDLTKLSDEELLDPLKTIAEHAYMYQGCQALRYDPLNRDVFGDGMLSHLYWQTRHSGRAKLGSLPSLFCGMPDLSHDAICTYFHQRGLVLMGEWRSNSTPIDPLNPLPENMEEVTHPQFHVLGYAFLSTNVVRSPDNRNSAFGGYCFFREAYRSPQQTVLTYLGLAYLFQEMSLVNLHGVRYADNKLTAKFVGKFGFRDIGVIPNYMYNFQVGTLVDGVLSTLDREELEDRLRQVLWSLQQPAQP